MSLGELATCLWAMHGEPAAADHSVDDVPDALDAAVSWLVTKKITTGIRASTFSPADPLTRGHLVTFLWRCKKEPAVTVNNNSPRYDAGITDTDTTDHPESAQTTSGVAATTTWIQRRRDTTNDDSTEHSAS
ncbi:MAG: hypothetical protein KTV16_09940 [Acidimicrobiia bacterium]|nr:hypothetical protein [Acidimicrobiia bacterium]